MIKNLRRRIMSSALVAGSLMSGVLPAVSFAESSGDSWQFAGEIYLWGAGFDVTTAAGDDIEISFSDILDNLDFALMGTLAAQKNEWTLFADMIYMDISSSKKATGNIIGHPVKLKVDIGLESFISTLGAGYSFKQTETTELRAIAGARYLWMDTTLKYDIGNRVSGKASDSGSIWDGIIGLQGQTELSDKWYLIYYADVGTGGSDLTWQAKVGVNYRFSKVDASFGYRYLDWQFDGDDALDDLVVSGPYAGVRFRF